MGTEKVQHEYGADEIQILKVLRQSANVLVCTLEVHQPEACIILYTRLSIMP